MSWLSELSSKAENLLNKIDQSAATSFHGESQKRSYSPSEQRIGELTLNKESKQAIQEPYSLSDKSPKTSLPNLSLDSNITQSSRQFAGERSIKSDLNNN